MPSYNIDIAEIGQIKVEKKRGMRSIRMRIDRNGKPVVSAPWHVPKPYIIKFVIDRRDWIIQNAENSETIYRDGIYFADGIKLNIQSGHARNYAKMSGSELNVKLSGHFSPENQTQQKYIHKKIIEAITVKAENQLLPKLHQLSVSFGIDFNQAYVKRLTSRWGSCDHHKNITLNIFLTQVPSEIQNYVMIHELTHVLHLNHSKKFWDTVESMMPNYKIVRKQLKQYKTRVQILQ